MVARPVANGAFQNFHYNIHVGKPGTGAFPNTNNAGARCRAAPAARSLDHTGNIRQEKRVHAARFLCSKSLRSRGW